MATKAKVPYGGHRTYATATVSTAATGLSDVIDVGGLQLKSVELSTAWTAAAGLTFMASAVSSGNLQSVRHTTANTELNYATTASHAISVDPKLFEGYKYIQLRSGTTAVPVAQAAARTVYLGLDLAGK